MSRKSTFTLSKSTKKIDETIDDDVRNVSTALETLRWIPDNEKADCTSCHKEFSVTVRRHHCRACGEIFCHDCSSMCVIIPRGRIISKNMRFPTDDWKTPLRTCTNCAVSLGHKPPPTLGAQLYVDGSLPTEIPMVNRRWVPDKEQGKCIGCDRSFSLIRRRHHCRACGLIFCNDCSSDKCLIPRQLIIAPNEKALAQIDVALGHRLRTCHRCARALENVQEDLRAIDPKAELSYQRRAFQTTAPVKEKKKKKPPTTTITSNSDDDDVKKPSLTSANGTKGKNGVKTTTANKKGTNSNASKKKPKNTASISSTVGGGGVSSSSSVGGLITAGLLKHLLFHYHIMTVLAKRYFFSLTTLSQRTNYILLLPGRKVSFDETSMFSASPSVLSAQTAPPTFHRHSPFQVHIHAHTLSHTLTHTLSPIMYLLSSLT